MPMWVWSAIGLGSVLGLSLLVGFAIVRVLEAIGRQLSETYETGGWAMAPPTRAPTEVEKRHPDKVEANSSH